ncbi:MAG: hypothetical protein GX184_02025 [Clostridiaceae bacterium]|nr:hypothetical protein [Clostridiaceae bacterium]
MDRILILACDVGNASGEDGTSLGSAIICGVAGGVFSSIEEGVKSIKTVGRVSFDAEESLKYREVYDIYKKLYPALKHTFSNQG